MASYRSLRISDVHATPSPRPFIYRISPGLGSLLSYLPPSWLMLPAAVVADGSTVARAR
jgi:hypothetical protein